MSFDVLADSIFSGVCLCLIITRVTAHYMSEYLIVFHYISLHLVIPHYISLLLGIQYTSG